MANIVYHSDSGKLVCLRCRAPELQIVWHRDLGPDGSSDERQEQKVVCSECGHRGRARYDASRRGGSEREHHYMLDPILIRALRSLRPGERSF